MGLGPTQSDKRCKIIKVVKIGVDVALAQFHGSGDRDDVPKGADGRVQEKQRTEEHAALHYDNMILIWVWYCEYARDGTASYKLLQKVADLTNTTLCNLPSFGVRLDKRVHLTSIKLVYSDSVQTDFTNNRGSAASEPPVSGAILGDF